MSQALYRKYRSKSLDEIVGQDHITSMLKRAIKKGRVAHAYLLTGPRGVGKTSIARILAHEINQLEYSTNKTHLDIIEIDAASNNGVDDIRDLREKVNIAPTNAKYKVYIIDEVHMLTKAAFNALLKTLEEPPEHIVFVLATTDVEKLPPTILSRVQRFNFRSISPETAAAHLRTISNQENIKIDNDALELIAHHGDGSFRDSISILDQVSTLSQDDETISRDMVEQLLGLTSENTLTELIKSHQAGDISNIAKIIKDLEDQGLSASVTVQQLIRLIRKNAQKNPELLHLADKLLDVSKSAQPNIKLLTTLTLSHIPIQSTTHLGKSQPVKAAPVTQAASQSAPTQASTKKDQPSPIKQKPQPETRSKDKPENTPTEAPIKPMDTQDFPWDELLAATKNHSIGTRDSLKKCTYNFDGKTLRLWAGNRFNKTILENQKHTLEITKSLADIGMSEITLEVIGKKEPPKDSETAAIAAMMGGGEEVDAKI